MNMYTVMNSKDKILNEKYIYLSFFTLNGERDRRWGGCWNQKRVKKKKLKLKTKRVIVHKEFCSVRVKTIFMCTII